MCLCITGQIIVNCHWKSFPVVFAGSLVKSFGFTGEIFWLLLLCGQVFLGPRSSSWVLAMKCATGRREVYSMQIMLQQLLLCIGPSVSCWLPKCHRQPCFCLSLCPLPCPVLFSEVGWLLMAPSRQRAPLCDSSAGPGREPGTTRRGGDGLESI